MSYVQHLEELHGLPVFDLPWPDADADADADVDADAEADAAPRLPEAGAVAWRLAADPYGDHSEEGFADLWQRFLATVDPTGVRALVIGQWGEVYDVDSSLPIGLLVAARDRFPALRALFLGDLEQEEAEISWIEQSDVTAVLDAFPLLEELGVRGGTKLRFPAVTHAHLHTLRVESGGLPGEAVRGLAASTFPALTELELWLGVSEYGGDTTAADLAPILSGGRFPALRRLGLRNSEIQDELAAAVAAAPVVAQLEQLDLSLGVLTDDGAAALLSGQPLTHLSRLDLHHNYLTEPVAARVRAALEPRGVRLDVSETGDVWEDDGVVHRFTAVAE